MQELTLDFEENIKTLDKILNINENFDLIKREMEINSQRVVMYYVDGFVTAAIMQKLMMHLTTVKDFGNGEEGAVRQFVKTSVPSVEVDAVYDFDTIVTMVLSGCSAILAQGFGNGAVIVDARSYPARVTEEPGNDKVMRGARDGFVETLIFNTAMVRRRIRDPKLTVKYANVGQRSKTDIAIVYIDGKADPVYVKQLIEKINSIKTDALPMGHQSLIECLIKRRWYNPFPKVRCTERPDAACASILEGSVVVLCDTSPEAMILPTAIFDFLQEADDYYYPCFTGTYLRLIRQMVFLGAIFLTPIWYTLVVNAAHLPPWIEFIVPKDTGEVPIIAQLLIVEFVLDGLKLASLNTPNVLSNSFSVVGGLLLGDFAVQIGWLCPDAIFYMAIEAIAGFTQSNYELGYAFKYMRILSIILIHFLNFWGLIIGTLVTIVLIVTNETVLGKHDYLYPLIPFNGKALKALFFRVKKQ
ncbi:MAG: spore germination protein [Ruminococcaceae bacterium]|nr:spore germination protein [Oscillospiraceae bacterium]